MDRREVGLGDVRAQLTELVAAAARGVDVVITHHRKPVARIVAVQVEEAMQARTSSERTIHDSHPAAFHLLFDVDPGTCSLCGQP